MRKKLNHLDYFSQLYNTSVEDLDERSQKILFAHLYEQNECLFLGLDCCESPIEKMMVIALEKYNEKFKELSEGMFDLNPQDEVDCEGKIYRVDLSLTVILNMKEIKIAIECDGHEFHEKTKIQAAKDKQRERALTKYGFIVMRFTGSEIWNDPYKCAEEVWQYVLSLK